jgi:hypothetical protein
MRSSCSADARASLQQTLMRACTAAAAEEAALTNAALAAFKRMLALANIL